MPATEQTWRSLKAMHLVFGVMALVMLVTTIWMLAVDHNREWKDHQRQFQNVETWGAEARVNEQRTEDFTRQHEELARKLAWTKAQVPDEQLVEQFKQLVKVDAEKRGVQSFDFGQFDGLYEELRPLTQAAANARSAAQAAEQESEKFWTAATQAQQKAVAAEVAGAPDALELKEQADEAAKVAANSRQKAVAAEKEALSAEQAAAEKREELLEILRSVIRDAKFREDNASRDVKFRRADLDQARSEYDLAVGNGKPQEEQEKFEQQVRKIEAEVTNLNQAYQDANAQRTGLERILRGITAEEDQARKNLEDQKSDLDRLEKALAQQQPNVAKKVLEAPIIDAFGRPLKIDQIWLPKLTINNNFRDVPRFDRCLTCHQAIDKTAAGSASDPAYSHQESIVVKLPTPEAAPPPELDADGITVPPSTRKVYGLQLAERGQLNKNDVTIGTVWPKTSAAEVGLLAGDVIEKINGVPILTTQDALNYLLHGTAWGKPLDLTIRRGLPHPYVTHPRLDLYLGSLSPHPMGKFGCTICHQGQGGATAFQWASHTPNNPRQAEEWARHHGWFNNHHWIYPMYPERFIESTCLKCHHEVTELEPSAKFPDPPAPKLVEGYEIVRQYGCYGCHEINGYDGPDRRIGPDMRAEPNFAAVAAQLRNDPGLDQMDPQVRGWIDELVRRPEDQTARHRLREALLADKALAAPKPTGESNTSSETSPGEPGKPRLSSTSHSLEAVLKDVDAPGQLRKVGPSLRHVASKLDFDFLYSWIRKPSDFRPSTRMPQFFELWDHLEGEGLAQAEKFEPIEIRSAVEYLLGNSQPFDFGGEKLPPLDQESVARGRELFQNRGCLACHQHHDFKGIEQNQGPDLSRIGAKLQRNPNGARWLYSWLKDPQHYSPRTLMPNLLLEPLPQPGARTSDPASDLVAFLLQSSEPWQPQNVPGAEMTSQERDALHELALSYLKEKFPVRRAEEFLKTGIPQSMAAQLKGDEVALVVPNGAGAREVEHKTLQYVGRRTLSKYGCAGCHDIPGYEDFKPIGTGLADWGRKDPTRLAFEQISLYVHAHAGHPEFENNEAKQRYEFFEEKLEHHEREGFIWQKLRAPRSYDYKKVENKGYNERLRMPKFNLDEDQIEAVVTFVLGLVAEPPPAQYVYQPGPREKAIADGRKVLEKYNCGGCHTLTMDRWDIAYRPGDFPDAPELPPEFPFVLPHFTPEEIKASLATDRRGLRRADLIGQPLLSETDGKPVRVDPDGVPIAEDDTESLVHYPFVLWDDVLVNGQPRLMGVQNLLVPETRIVNDYAPRGGDLARWLFPHVTAAGKQANPNLNVQEVWGWLPPPLMGEGSKVQTGWLHDFLLDPHEIRPAAVLRMPKFNMTSAEASTLVDYFAAVDNAEYPFEFDARTRESHLREVEADYTQDLRKALNTNNPRRNYLGDALKIVTDNNYCVKCHLLGDFVPPGSETALAPNLAQVHRRLRPEFVRSWVASPKRHLPYTGMPVNIPPNKPVDQNLFVGDSIQQLDGVVDLLMNYDQLTKEQFRIAPMIKPITPTTPRQPPAGE